MPRAALTPARVQAILQAIRNGATREAAAAIVGVTKAALYEWLARGRADYIRSGPLLPDGSKPLQIRPRTPLYAELADGIKQAESEWEGLALERIRALGEARNDWTAYAWSLERRWPDRWGRRDRVTLEVSEHLGRQQEAVQRLLRALDSVLTDEQRAAVAEELGYIREAQDVSGLLPTPVAEEGSS